MCVCIIVITMQETTQKMYFEMWARNINIAHQPRLNRFTPWATRPLKSVGERPTHLWFS